MPPRLYHRTGWDEARRILASGFGGSVALCGPDSILTGVWLSTAASEGETGPGGRAVLEVILDVSDEELAAYEWLEVGISHRQFLVPAELVNSRSRVRLVE